MNHVCMYLIHSVCGLCTLCIHRYCLSDHVEISAVADIDSQGIVELVTNWSILVMLW